MIFPFKHRLGYARLMNGKEDEGRAILDNLRDDPEFQAMLEEKREEEELIRKLFYTKLREYHDRDELKWLKAQKG